MPFARPTNRQPHAAFNGAALRLFHVPVAVSHDRHGVTVSVGCRETPNERRPVSSRVHALPCRPEQHSESSPFGGW